MRAGVVLPQGWIETFSDSSAAVAWQRAVSSARTAERLGFESGWFYDHFHRWPVATQDPVFESFTGLTGIAGVTRRLRLGHLVICAGFRNPALVAKMASTLDVISGGRFDLGIGAGWYQEEWHAFGYDFPDRSTRLATLRDHLEVIANMLRPGPATYPGRHARVDGAVNEPKPLQPKLPIMVGGNGPNVTWRLAARYADELNLDGLSAGRTREALPVIAARCEEVGRDPASLRVSVHIFVDGLGAPGRERADQLGAYGALGIWRIMTPPPGLTRSDEVLGAFAEDCVAADVEMTPEPRP
jgi:F420-dependent oxidoreductase-like protein